jgi:hypothetical protein
MPSICARNLNPNTETPRVLQSATAPVDVARKVANAEPLGEPQPTPMARLPSARQGRPGAKRRAAAAPPPVRSASPDQDGSFEIDIITGGSSLDGLAYRVLWKGWDALLDWWEALDAAGSFDDEAYTGRLVQVLPRGIAADVSGGKAPPKGKCLVLVLGQHLTDGAREAYEADGTCHELDLAQCKLDSQPPCDWLLKLDDERAYLTDAVMGEAWASDAALIKARSGWDGSEYPSIDDAMAVLRVASELIQEWGSDGVAAAMLEVHVMINTPTQQQRETAKAHAATVRRAFLFGGLLHDCLSVIMTVEPSCVQQMVFFAKQFARQHPGGAAWDDALVAGAI